MKRRALAFSREWAQDTHEEAEAKEFLTQFLHIFDIARRRVATFEHRVNLGHIGTSASGEAKNKDGYIDLLWKGTLLVEMKSRGKDLDKAYQQAKAYCQGLKAHEVPQLIMVCDFHHFAVYDENGDCTTFTLPQLAEYLPAFDVLTGRHKRIITEQDPVNIQAAELMGRLHDKLQGIGYHGHHLELYLVRLLFLLFADDTGLFERGGFHDYMLHNTREDGADLALHLAQMFDVLNRPPDKRFTNLNEDLLRFPYVNGKLFEEQLPLASFDSAMRQMLLDACKLDWGKISPAIFGSLFQSVMDPKARRNLGAHYTSEKNILKVIEPLFLDELRQEYDKCRHKKSDLKKLQARISQLKLLDPACGCGNFLIIAYRELRLLEMEIVSDILEGQQVTDISSYLLLDVDQFYGIEYEEFPAQIAQVAMWLMDHQMNVRASQRFGDYYARLPLRKSANIVHGNALRMDWQSLLNKERTINIKAEETNVFFLNEPELEYKKLNVYTQRLNINPQEAPAEHSVFFDYIMGNPPFIGTAYQNQEQKEDMQRIFHDVKSFGMLDYVTAWYKLAAEYFHSQKNNKTVCAFVSTNSIAQGEQVGILWSMLFGKYKCKIHFCHQTFKWGNEAKGNAAVHVAIIGFSNFDISNKVIYQYRNIKTGPIGEQARNINPYLVGGSDIFLNSRTAPICDVPRMQSGSAARDGGFLILTNEEKETIESIEPQASQFFNRFISGEDVINNVVRWCIWLKNVPPEKFRSIKEFHIRFKEVRSFRENSTRNGTKRMAALPYLFAEERQPSYDFLVIPKVSSENRAYIPIAYLTKDFIVSDKTFVIPQTSNYHFGVLTSLMHNTWMRFTCGRLKSDYSYSNTIVYNNFPWPIEPTEKQQQAVEAAAQAVLDARALFPDASLADLYDPNTMPPPLVKAHQALDKAVDQCYRAQPFANESKRIEYLFELYEQYTAGMFGREKKGRGK